MKQTETDAEKIERLENEKSVLLAMLDRYVPTGMVVPDTGEYDRWRSDSAYLHHICPSWR